MEDLFDKIRQILYSLYRVKEINKDSIWQYNKLMLNLADKIIWKKKVVALSDLSICYTSVNMKHPYKATNLKC